MGFHNINWTLFQGSGCLRTTAANAIHVKHYREYPKQPDFRSASGAPSRLELERSYVMACIQNLCTANSEKFTEDKGNLKMTAV